MRRSRPRTGSRPRSRSARAPSASEATSSRTPRRRAAGGREQRALQARTRDGSRSPPAASMIRSTSAAEPPGRRPPAPPSGGCRPVRRARRSPSQRRRAASAAAIRTRHRAHRSAPRQRDLLRSSTLRAWQATHGTPGPTLPAQGASLPCPARRERNDGLRARQRATRAATAQTRVSDEVGRILGVWRASSGGEGVVQGRVPCRDLSCAFWPFVRMNWSSDRSTKFCCRASRLTSLSKAGPSPVVFMTPGSRSRPATRGASTPT